jgi:hypothetical protein
VQESSFLIEDVIGKVERRRHACSTDRPDSAVLSSIGTRSSR